MSENIVIDLDDDIVADMMLLFAQNNLSTPSLELFKEKINDGTNVYKAVGHAVFNEQLIKILEHMMKQENKIDTD